jgi:hypothetical protein
MPAGLVRDIGGSNWITTRSRWRHCADLTPQTAVWYFACRFRNRPLLASVSNIANAIVYGFHF